MSKTHVDGIFDPSELARAKEALGLAFTTLRERGLIVETEAPVAQKRLTQLCLQHMDEEIDAPALAELIVEAYSIAR